MSILSSGSHGVYEDAIRDAEYYKKMSMLRESLRYRLAFEHLNLSAYFSTNSMY